MSESPLLIATGVTKTYAAVAALNNASIKVASGEVVALMGANGAGKSTLVKILTGAISATSGVIQVRGQVFKPRTPADALRRGVVPVYQEPSLIPDLTVADNLKLIGTPLEPFRYWVNELGVAALDYAELARRLPLAVQRILDFARALAIDPDVLLLDEITAALPTDLVDKVLDVVRRQKDRDRSVVYISHRFAEIASVCDRATVLRDGETVGDLRIEPGVEETVVRLMLGERVKTERRVLDIADSAVKAVASSVPRLRVKNLALGGKLRDVSFNLCVGEVLGIVALEGQGQDELFAALTGQAIPEAGTIEVDGVVRSFRHPADAIAAGHVYVPGDRAEALLMQRSVRENIALPLSTKPSQWGWIHRTLENQRVDAAIARLQIDTRAQGEVQRLSGGNQQKVTIARWITGDVRTLLCFDPTRGIDIRTKHEIYPLLRELAAQGASILLYTSELAEIQLACDRALVIFGGRVVTELNTAEADEEHLMRAAYALQQPGSAVNGPAME